MHVHKWADTKGNAHELCLCTLIILAAHPFVLWHLLWPLPCLYVFANWSCLVSDILRDILGGLVRDKPQVHRGRQSKVVGESEGGENVRAFFLFLCQSGEIILQYNSTDRQRHSNICFWAISEHHSQPGSYLNIDECFPHLIKPYQLNQNGQQQMGNVGKEIVCAGLDHVLIKTFNLTEWTRRQNKNKEDRGNHPLTQRVSCCENT